MNELYETALKYCEMGLAVFPLVPRSKNPLTAHGVKDATTDPVQIKEWWSKTPNANIAIACGQVSGGLCIIDLDSDVDSGAFGIKNFEDWQSAHGAIPPSWLAKTGKESAYHYYFIADDVVRNRVGILPHVDVRGDNGYVVAPPSIHPNGTKYAWADNLAPGEVPITSMNETLRAFLYQGTPIQRAGFTTTALVPQGERNATMFKTACSLQAKGFSDESIIAAVERENQTKCNPPLSDLELRNIINSVLKYEKGKAIYFTGDGAYQGARDLAFSTNEKGMIRKIRANYVEAIKYSPEMYGTVGYNKLANNIYVVEPLPWEEEPLKEPRPWNNSDDAYLRTFLEESYALDSPEKADDALRIVATENSYHPIQDALLKIHSDYGACSGSIRKLLPEYMGADDTEYNYQVMKVFMLGAIARVFNPGVKFDYTMILYGAQGFGKSEFLRHLAINSDWFNDNFTTFDGDKAIEKLNGMWIIELAELKALKSAKDSESFKAFLTSRVDTYRAPYARRVEQRPRMCVFAGTTNNKNVFVDKTGNRRFLPITVRKGHQTKDLFGDQEAVMEDFKMAWAEAMDMFEKAKRKPTLRLSKTIEAEAEIMQQEFSEEDYRVGMIQNWLDYTDADRVCIPMLIEYVLDADLESYPKHKKKELQEIMDNEIQGWSRIHTKDGRSRMRFNKYGMQIAFTRLKE